MRFSVRDRAGHYVASAEHPARAKAVLVLWGLFGLGTLSFAVLDAQLTGISLSYWQVLPVVVVLAAATVVVLGED